jgi:hypothetical protein
LLIEKNYKQIKINENEIEFMLETLTISLTSLRNELNLMFRFLFMLISPFGIFKPYLSISSFLKSEFELELRHVPMIFEVR